MFCLIFKYSYFNMLSLLVYKLFTLRKGVDLRGSIYSWEKVCDKIEQQNPSNT